MAFKQSDGFVVALTYGSDTDWVKNVFAMGGCYITQRGKRYTARDPRILGQATGMLAMPRIIQFALKRLRVDEFLALSTTTNCTSD